MSKRGAVKTTRTVRLPADNTPIEVSKADNLPTLAATADTPKPKLKTAHFSLCNGSGMHSVAKSMVEAERLIGIDARLVNIEVDTDWDQVLDADVHISHTHIPVMYRGKAWLKQVTKPFRMVGVFHGTPEHVFTGSVNAAENGAYAPSDSFMIMQHDLKRSHARVTFWERHKWIYDSMIHEGARLTDLVPLGVDRVFWAAGASRGKYAGNPSLWSGENCHEIKWPLDLVLMWDEVAREVDDATLHLCYLPFDQHKHWFPLANANGAHYRSHMGAWTYAHEELRNIFKSVDYVTSFVQKGDFNRICLEALAAGARVISHRGNPYAHWWIDEGDQRIQAAQLIDILKGNVEPRADRVEVPDHSEMAKAMQAIYEAILP